MNYTLDKIEELRRERNIKVNHLCKATGVPQSTYTTWVAKDRTPQSKHLKPIAEYFNKPISYFYDDEKIKADPVGTGQLHAEMTMDKDFVELFEDFRKLDDKEKQIVKKFVHSMVEA